MAKEYIGEYNIPIDLAGTEEGRRLEFIEGILKQCLFYTYTILSVHFGTSETLPAPYSAKCCDSLREINSRIATGRNR